MTPKIVFLLNKSLEALRVSNLETAEIYLKQVMRLQSNNPHALRLFGVIATQRKQYREALNFLNSSIKYLPNNSLAFSNLGTVFHYLKEYSNALDMYDKSIRLDKKYEEAWLNKGNVLFDLSRHQDALYHYETAINLKPNYPQAWSNKGNVLLELRRHQEARYCYEKAISLEPGYAEAWANKGHLLHELGYFNDAIHHYDAALKLKPSYHYSEWNKSLTLLLNGNFEGGLPLYERRWQIDDSKGAPERRFFKEPTWLGSESLSGKSIFLYSEQGLGDFIQFCRYTTLCAESGANVLLEAPEPLISLLDGLKGISQVIAKGSPAPSFDYQCPLLSLPLAFKTTLATIPNWDQYIDNDKNLEKVLKWKTKLGLKTRKRIGLAWSGNSNHKNDQNRSLPLKDIIPFLPDGFEYVSLQKEVREVDLPILKSTPWISVFSNEISDFSDTAALIDCLDIVISVDTSVAHLSGALGKKTWILLPFVPDWRWLLNRADSPWYPTVSLYRQPALGDWLSVLQNISASLSSLIAHDNL